MYLYISLKYKLFVLILHIMWQNKDEYIYAEEDQMYETQVAFKG